MFTRLLATFTVRDIYGPYHFEVYRQDIKKPYRSHICSICGSRFSSPHLKYEIRDKDENKIERFYRACPFCHEELEARMAAFLVELQKATEIDGVLTPTYDEYIELLSLLEVGDEEPPDDLIAVSVS